MKISGREFRQASDTKITETLELAELGKKARIVFHDLSNHLTALTLSVGHLEENLARDTKRLREYSKRSEKTRVQMEYVANLLRSHLENTPDVTFNLSAEIASILDTFAEKAKLDRVKIRLNLRRDIEITGNKNAFIHAVTNLISNALESFNHSPVTKKLFSKSVREITIALKKSRSCTLLTVSDTGCGIAKTDLKKIFDPKFTTKPNGHGIGLSVTKEYVEQKFGGTIGVASSENGTQFLIRIPNNTY